MNDIRLHDLRFRRYLPHESIVQRIAQMADEINRDFDGQHPLFLGILNGCFMFAADLMKNITIPCEISFIRLSSYRGTTSTNQVTMPIGLDRSVQDRNVIILEDIVDTGKTLYELFRTLRPQRPSQIAIAALLLKPAALQYHLHIDYVGFQVPNDFLVGYGLDYDGLGRNLRDIYSKIPG
ncbi:MAG: hypoxanthine phosphoribosyltransferase [Chitinophagales bacterium]|nr:hypoxanthine phosphoribosyltransferase [Chitinophagales bacterium]MDW8393301.1 hypoxanthine phosphoribosyltransferase [Chitinophagales bacterium]